VSDWKEDVFRNAMEEWLHAVEYDRWMGNQENCWDYLAAAVEFVPALVKPNTRVCRICGSDRRVVKRMCWRGADLSFREGWLCFVHDNQFKHGVGPWST